MEEAWSTFPGNVFWVSMKNLQNYQVCLLVICELCDSHLTAAQQMQFILKPQAQGLFCQYCQPEYLIWFMASS